MDCPVLSCTVLHCPALSCSVMHCVLSCTVLHCPAWSCTVLHCPALSCILHCPALSCTALHCPALSCIVLDCSALSCTVLHDPALSFIVMHCPTSVASSLALPIFKTSPEIFSLIQKGWNGLLILLFVVRAAKKLRSAYVVANCINRKFWSICGRYAYVRSVANSVQNFFRQVQKKNSAVEAKSSSPTNFHFLKELKFGPFSALFVHNRPKFGRRFVRPLHILFGPFWLMRPNNRPVDNTVCTSIQ